MLFRFCNLFTLVFLTGVASSGGDVRPNYSNFPSTVSVTQYAHPEFDLFHRTLYEHRDGSFVPGETFSGSNPIQCIRAFLHTQQNFAMSIQMKRNGLSPEDADKEIELGMALNQQQVAFIESTRLVPIEKYLGEVDQKYIDTMSPQIEGHYRVRTGSLWTLSGQSVSPESAEVKFQDLLWQKEPGAKAVADQYLDRKKYKFISEWGRAGQLTAGEIGAPYATAAAMDYRRVKAMGGNVNDAYVFFSSADPGDIRLYDKVYPGTRFPPGVNRSSLDMKETVFAVPLSKMLELYPPSKYSQKLATLKKLSGDTLTELQTLDLLNEAKTLDAEDLNFATPSMGRQHEKVLLVYQSITRTIQIQSMLHRFGITADKFVDMTKYILQFPSTFLNTDPSLTDAHHTNNSEVLRQWNGVEISNLDGKYATDPQYVEAAVLGSYAYYLKKFFGIYKNIQPTPHDVDRVIQTLHQANVHFVLTTADNRLIDQVMLLHPSEIARTHVSQGPHVVEGYSFAFSIQRLHELIDANPEFYYKKCEPAIFPGTARAADDVFDGSFLKWRARRDSNSRPTGSKPATLSS